MFTGHGSSFTNGDLQTVITANDESLKKLMSLAENKLVATTNKKIGSCSTKKKLEDDLQLAKEEMKEAEKVWNELIGGSVTPTVHSHLLFNIAPQQFSLWVLIC